MLKKVTKPEPLRADEPRTYQEFVDAMLRKLHDALLTGGSAEMHTVLWQWLSYYTDWQKRFGIVKRKARKEKK